MCLRTCVRYKANNQSQSLAPAHSLHLPLRLAPTFDDMILDFCVKEPSLWLDDISRASVRTSQLEWHTCSRAFSADGNMYIMLRGNPLDLWAHIEWM